MQVIIMIMLHALLAVYGDVNIPDVLKELLVEEPEKGFLKEIGDAINTGQTIHSYADENFYSDKETDARRQLKKSKSYSSSSGYSGYSSGYSGYSSGYSGYKSSYSGKSSGYSGYSSGYSGYSSGSSGYSSGYSGSSSSKYQPPKLISGSAYYCSGCNESKHVSSGKLYNSYNYSTYKRLKRWFKPDDVYLEYYSDYYGEEYFDGYGWNFYTNEGDYYDPQHIKPKTNLAGTAGLAVGLASLFGCIVGGCLLQAIRFNEAQEAAMKKKEKNDLILHQSFLIRQQKREDGERIIKASQVAPEQTPQEIEAEQPEKQAMNQAELLEKETNKSEERQQQAGGDQQKPQCYCDQNHQMQWCQTDPYGGGGVTCNQCDRAVAVIQWFHHCYTCECDYCQECGLQHMR